MIEKKRPACSAASQRAGWVELRPRTAAAAGGAVSELPGGCCLCGKEPQSLQHKRGRASSLPEPSAGAGEQSDSRDVICVKRPSLT